MQANRAVTWCLAGVGLVGCGRVDGAIPIQDTATAFAQAICPKAYSCCTAQQLMGNAAAGTTEAECEVDTAQKFQQQLQLMQTSNRCASWLVCDGAGTMDTSDDVCVAPQNDPGAPGSQCFYGGGCSTAGGRPGLAELFSWSCWRPGDAAGVGPATACRGCRCARRGRWRRPP
jgi:hypothetical protein